MLEGGLCVVVPTPAPPTKKAPTDATLILRLRKRSLAPFITHGKLIVETPTIVHYAIVLVSHDFSRYDLCCSPLFATRSGSRYDVLYKASHRTSCQ